MGTFTEVAVTEGPLKIDGTRKAALESFIYRGVEDGLMARFPQERMWKECLRQYQGVPRQQRKSFPIEDAPNLEIPLGAIAADAIYAIGLDLVFGARPPITALATRHDQDDESKLRVDQAAALQDWIDWRVENDMGLREAIEHSWLDNCQLGTGLYYIPYLSHRKKTRVRTVLEEDSKVLSIPPEDCITPGGKNVDLQKAPLVGIRFWYNRAEFLEKAKLHGWDLDAKSPGSPAILDSVTLRRERLGRTTSTPTPHELQLYEVWLLWVLFDIDGDGEREDLMVSWHRTARRVLAIDYNPYDTRPLEVMRYQLKAHLFWGMGVVEMIRGFQEEVTDLHNERVLNQRLANTRCFKARHGAVQGGTLRLWSNKVIPMSDPEDLQELKLSDVYNSASEAEAIALSLAERRVGVNELSLPRPSQVLGSRTPATTSLSLLQQANRRFTPAFDQFKEATARAVKQTLYREQEILLAGGDASTRLEAKMLKVLGDNKSTLVRDLLRDVDFDNAVRVELTAASASMNRDADRQMSLTLLNVLGQYYQKALELVVIASNPQTPPPVAEVAKKIADAANALIERTLRTFDQIRDPERYLVQMNDELDQIEVEQSGMQGLGQIITALAGARAQERPLLGAPNGVA